MRIHKRQDRQAHGALQQRPSSPAHRPSLRHRRSQTPPQKRHKRLDFLSLSPCKSAQISSGSSTWLTPPTRSHLPALSGSSPDLLTSAQEGGTLGQYSPSAAGSGMLTTDGQSHTTMQHSLWSRSSASTTPQASGSEQPQKLSFMAGNSAAHSDTRAHLRLQSQAEPQAGKRKQMPQLSTSSPHGVHTPNKCSYSSDTNTRGSSEQRQNIASSPGCDMEVLTDMHLSPPTPPAKKSKSSHTTAIGHHRQRAKPFSPALSLPAQMPPLPPAHIPLQPRHHVFLSNAIWRKSTNATPSTPPISTYATSVPTTPSPTSLPPQPASLLEPPQQIFHVPAFPPSLASSSTAPLPEQLQLSNSPQTTDPSPPVSVVSRSPLLLPQARWLVSLSPSPMSTPPGSP